MWGALHPRRPSPSPGWVLCPPSSDPALHWAVGDSKNDRPQPLIHGGGQKSPGWEVGRAEEWGQSGGRAEWAGAIREGCLEEVIEWGIE